MSKKTGMYEDRESLVPRLILHVNDQGVSRLNPFRRLDLI